MTAHGAAGETYDAMAGTLGISGLSRAEVSAGNAALRDELVRADKKVRLEIANSLWLRKGTKLQQRFSDDCGRYYNAAVTPLDFARPDAVTTINNWVEKHTGGRIKQVISQLTPEEIIVLVNAVYFKGTWATGFDPKQTAERKFRFSPDSAARRQMMRREGEFRYKGDSTMQAVALPYGDGRLNMYLFLPREHGGMGGLIDRMTPGNAADLFAGFNEKEGEVVLPRFKVEFEQSLTKVLKLLGMKRAFADEADFSEMVTPPQTAAISEVLHKTFIEVNEEGTEAAAVTVVTMRATASMSGGGGQEWFSLVCDHPFICAIRDDVTGSVLFVGAIFDPKQ
jgi:serpin B